MLHVCLPDSSFYLKETLKRQRTLFLLFALFQTPLFIDVKVFLGCMEGGSEITV